MDEAALNKRFERATALWHDEQWDAAIQAFAELVALIPDDWRARLMLGAYLWMRGHLQEAEPHLRRATELRPTSERASLPLFHVLWALGRDKEAFEEIYRFLQVGEPVEYRKLLAEWHAEWREKGIIP